MSLWTGGLGEKPLYVGRDNRNERFGLEVRKNGRSSDQDQSAVAVASEELSLTRSSVAPIYSQRG